MSAAPSRHVVRHVVVASSVMVSILATVVALGGLAERPVDLARRVTEVPAVVVGGADTCERGREPPDVDRPPITPSVGRVTSAQVLSCPEAFDGLTVAYAGEVVGDLLPRDGGAWVQVNDDPYALDLGPLPTHGRFAGTNSSLAVWLPDELVGRIGGLGRYGRRGDVVRIEGAISRTDPDDGGGLTLRATDLEVLRPSEELPVPVEPVLLVLAAVSLAAAAAITLARVGDRRRRH